MRNLFLAILIAIFSLGVLISDAQAKRFGGGKSFGMSRSASSFSRPNTSRVQPAAAPASGASKWLGPLAGLAMGGLLASLFMGHGIGSGILSWLMVAGVGLILWRLVQSRLRPAAQNAHFQAQAMPNSSQNPFSGYQTPAQERLIFDEVAFLRQAKATFIRLQTAYDNKNLTDIREFTSPEVFAEIQLQVHERGDELNQTDVLHVDAQLLDIKEDSDSVIASVQFAAQIREELNAAAVDVKEIWHFHKNETNQSWLVAGIQQA